MKMLATIMGAVAVALSGSSLSAQGAPDGKALYAKHCQACHGPRGTPSAAMAKSMKVPKIDEPFLAGRSQDSVVRVIRVGSKGMKGLEGKLNPGEMAAIATYLRELVKPAAGT